MDTDSAFAGVPHTPRNHLTLLLYEAALSVLYYLRVQADEEEDLDAILGRHAFLRPYHDALTERLPADLSWGAVFEWLRQQTRTWEDAAPRGALPLRELQLSPSCLLTLVTAGLIEEDPAFGALFSSGRPGVPAARPTISLLHDLALYANDDTLPDAWAHCAPLIEQRLVEVLNPDAPRGDWALRVPSLVWNAVRGECGAEPISGVHLHNRQGFGRLSELILPPSQRERITELAAVLHTGDARLLVVRGMPGSERLELVGSLARGLDRALLEIRDPAVLTTDAGRLLGCCATLLHALPVFALELAAGETFEVPVLAGYAGPIAIVLGREGGLSGPRVEESVLIELDAEPADVRYQYWAESLNRRADDLLPLLAERFMIGGRYIRQTAKLALSVAALDQRERVTLQDVRVAARSINRQQLDSLATRLEDGGRWDQLVVHTNTASDLRTLEQRCRQRERLAQSMAGALPGGLTRGVRALFEGPSGTGKTLAARILAAELGLDLYRVDLAAIVNKYIGETEKNLSRVLGRAEDLDVVLLLDEGDTLMARRTDVKSANERYANLETNYLLQRLDGYTGIVIVTTNLCHHIDNAFHRRMDVLVRFHLPDPEQRLRLWQVHLPREHVVPFDVLHEVAYRHALTGGQIRNAAIAATLHALERNGRVNGFDLEAAVDAEYRKAGAPPLNSPRLVDDTPVDATDAMSAFLGAIS